MPKERSLSRREFLEILGLASVAALGACTPREPVVITATPSHVPPSPSPEPTPTLKIETEADDFEMVLVEGGTFEMGAANGLPFEQPVHTVVITKPYYLSRYEVTFYQYDRFCDDVGKNRAQDEGQGRGARAVGNVSWYDAVEFCNWLSQKEGLEPCYSGTGLSTECDFATNGYRLPTEAEWEFAARGGNRGEGYEYAGSNIPDEIGWYLDNSNGFSNPVGAKSPNELGLFDMSGNVQEWCWDWYDAEYYGVSPLEDPRGPSVGRSLMGQQRIKRGGSFFNQATLLRVAARNFDPPNRRTVYDVYFYGFRVARTA